MSLPLKLNFSDYDNFLTEPNYTTSAEAQDYFRNMDMLVEALIDVGLWQPETNYPNGHVVFSPNMPNGAEAVCVATNGGKSSNTEPSWGEVGGDNVSDGTCFWQLRWKHWSKSVEEIADLTTGATNRLPNKAYAAGNVVYTDSNLSVALKCTTAGTTSANELDISSVEVGSSVTDGSVVWEVVSRDTVATIEKERPIKTFTSLEQLGLDNNASESDIAVTIPNDSMLTFYADTATNLNLHIPFGGYICVQRMGGSYVEFTITNPWDERKILYKGTYTATLGFTGWQRIATKGALSMPSKEYIYIYGTSTGEWWKYYSAPADGYFCMKGTQVAVLSILVNNLQTDSRSIPKTTIERAVYAPVSAGDVVAYAWDSGEGSTPDIYFIYAQSEV